MNIRTPRSRRLALAAAITILGISTISASAGQSAHAVKKVSARPGATAPGFDNAARLNAGPAVKIAGHGFAGIAVGEPAPEGGSIEPGFDIMPVDPEQVNQEQRDLATYLDSLGLAYTLHDEDGFVWVEYDYNNTAVQNAVEDFMWERHPMPQDVIDQINAETDAIATYLRAHGIEVTVTTDRHGVSTATWDYENPAAQTAVEDYYWEKYPIPQDQIDAMNAEAAELVAYLQGQGIDATLNTDRHGLQTADWNYDDPAAQTALEDYYWEKYPVPQDQIDAMNADTEAMVAFLQGKGIDASIDTDRHGIKTAAYEWSEAVDAALQEYWESHAPTMFAEDTVSDTWLKTTAPETDAVMVAAATSSFAG